MKQNSFLARMTSKMLAFAVVGMLCVGFAACSKDDETPTNKTEETKENEKKEQFTNTATFDGTEVKVKEVSLTNVKDNMYWLAFELEDGANATGLIVHFIPEAHNNKEIDLGVQSETDTSWSIFVMKGESFVCCGQEATSPQFKFDSGKMKLKIDMETKEFEIKIDNAKITTSQETMYGDGVEHIFSLSHKGNAVSE